MPSSISERSATVPALRTRLRTLTVRCVMKDERGGQRHASIKHNPFQEQQPPADLLRSTPAGMPRTMTVRMSRWRLERRWSANPTRAEAIGLPVREATGSMAMSNEWENGLVKRGEDRRQDPALTPPAQLKYPLPKQTAKHGIEKRTTGVSRRATAAVGLSGIAFGTFRHAAAHVHRQRLGRALLFLLAPGILHRDPHATNQGAIVLSGISVVRNAWV